jgi:hypothetical protein
MFRIDLDLPSQDETRQNDGGAYGYREHAWVGYGPPGRMQVIGGMNTTTYERGCCPACGGFYRRGVYGHSANCRGYVPSRRMAALVAAFIKTGRLCPVLDWPGGRARVERVPRPGRDMAPVNAEYHPGAEGWGNLAYW